MSAGPLCGCGSTHEFLGGVIFNNQQYCISKTFFLSTQTPSLSALLLPPPQLTQSGMQAMLISQSVFLTPPVM